MGARHASSRIALAALLAVAVCSGVSPAAAQGAADTYGPVGNETLWSIARKVGEGRPGSTAQIAWALYRANPDAFDGSPSKIRPGATLKIPNAATINEVPAAQAYAYLTGKSAPAAPAVAAPAVAAPAGRAPTIAGVELAPLLPGDPYQWLAVVGSGFATGATLELRDLAKDASVPSRKPQSVRDTRIEYAARFPEKTSRWQVVVRNPDGGRSTPFEFDGGQQVSLTLPRAAPAAAAPGIVTVPLATGRFGGSTHESAAEQIARRGPDEVYRFLAPLDEQYAGDVDYDYRLGTAALDSGRYSEAIFVLQRAVATRPGFAGARMELARAYYAQGDNESARREFGVLEKDNPPPGARRAIADYLDAIDRRASVYERQLRGYAELASGYDSNANGATDLQSFIDIPLDAKNRSTASSFYGLGAGGLVSHPFAPGWRLLGTGSAAYRGHPDAAFVDSQQLRVAGALEWRPNRYELSLQPSFGYAMLDGEDNHQILAVDLAATRHAERSAFSLNLRSGQTRYAEGLEVLDVDTLLYGVAARYTTLTMPRVQLLSAVTLGSDDAVDAGSPYGRDLTGARVGAIVDFGGGHSAFASIASLGSEYDGTFFVGDDREDTQLGATLGYEWGGLRAIGWTARAQLNYVDNDSSVPLYDYDRLEAGVSLRKEFR